MNKSSLLETFGEIDIYLFDQLLKGRFDNCQNVLDAGCGYGRNLFYFLKTHAHVFGVDQNASAIEEVIQLSARINPANPSGNFRVATIEELPFPADLFDLVICSAVLHFANNKDHFDKMLRSIWRVLKPGGFLFCRLASDIGIEELVVNIGSGRFHLPDGSDRFLVSQQMLLDYTKNLGGQLCEPIKTTNVQNVRCMTTWILQKKQT